MGDSERSVGTQDVGLGCGSLILIALIVWFFSSGSTEEVREDLQRVNWRLEKLEQQLDRIEKKLDAK